MSEFFDSESQNPTKINDIVADMKCLNDHQLNIIAALVKDLSEK